MAKRKSWSKVVSKDGVAVRLYERPGAIITAKYGSKAGGRTAGASGTGTGRKRLSRRRPWPVSWRPFASTAGRVSRSRSASCASLYLAHKILSRNAATSWNRRLSCSPISLEPGGRPFRMDDFGPDAGGSVPRRSAFGAHQAERPAYTREPARRHARERATGPLRGLQLGRELQTERAPASRPEPGARRAEASRAEPAPARGDH